jgi:hypothetical protein
MPSLCHAAPMRQHRKVVATGMKPIIRIQTERTRVRSHPLRDGIHDQALDLETYPAGGVPTLSPMKRLENDDSGQLPTMGTTPQGD